MLSLHLCFYSHTFSFSYVCLQSLAVPQNYVLRIPILGAWGAATSEHNVRAQNESKAKGCLLRLARVCFGTVNMMWMEAIAMLNEVGSCHYISSMLQHTDGSLHCTPIRASNAQRLGAEITASLHVAGA
mmetsp:Transcript_136156/g.236213  ORF Transcript_136156/g.236213 Transcript_136156/m.236213 type:complete len:129 (-) Transcript_136156:151-537(-)